MPISSKIRQVIVSIHQAFMQPKKSERGVSLRKQRWIETWTKIKELSPSELEELHEGLQTTDQTLRKLMEKIEALRTEKLREEAEKNSLENLNQWEEDEFLESKMNLPVFKEKSSNKAGRRWVITPPMERPKTTVEICQTIWVVLTNRAIRLVDKGDELTPSASRDMMIEKHRLAVVPNILDDQTVTDVITGKPLRNLYSITPEVKDTFLWLLAERAKHNEKFRRLFTKFLKKEVLKKEHHTEWAQKYSPIARTILKELESLR